MNWCLSHILTSHIIYTAFCWQWVEATAYSFLVLHGIWVYILSLILMWDLCIGSSVVVIDGEELLLTTETTSIANQRYGPTKQNLCIRSVELHVDLTFFDEIKNIIINNWIGLIGFANLSAHLAWPCWHFNFLKFIISCKPSHQTSPTKLETHRLLSFSITTESFLYLLVKELIDVMIRVLSYTFLRRTNAVLAHCHLLDTNTIPKHPSSLKYTQQSPKLVIWIGNATLTQMVGQIQ